MRVLSLYISRLFLARFVLGLVFLAVTTGLLVFDLKRPERFLFVILRPNWNSWLAKGGVILGVYGFLLTLWMAVVPPVPMPAKK